MPFHPDTIQRSRALAIVVLPFIGFVIAIFSLWNTYVFWEDLVLLVIIFFFTTLGVTMGFHRMLTHGGFQAPEWLRGLILILGTMAWEGSVMDWVATHIKHHAHSDDEGDPHSPIHGFWHAHMGWLFRAKNFAKAPEYAPHLLKDPTVVFVQKYTAVWMALALLIPFAIGGWTGLVWAGGVRIFLTTHLTWSVNSICHCFGRRDFETTDESRNEWVIAIVSLGEGWHNNHHAFPHSAFHGLRWWQIDVTGMMIRLLESCGLVWNVQRINEEVLHAQRERFDRTKQAARDLREQLLHALAAAQNEWARLLEKHPAPGEELRRSVLARLLQIDATVKRATNLKTQRLRVYLKEVQELKQRLQHVPA